jgi:hypothetical protein
LQSKTKHGWQDLHLSGFKWLKPWRHFKMESYCLSRPSAVARSSSFRDEN